MLKMIYLNLFLAFFRIGLFSIGGGYAALPLIQNEVVDTYSWMSTSEFADVVAISQMTPGSIAINAATFIGTRMGGILGALAATFACILPSCSIVVLLAILYKKYSKVKYIQGILNGLRPAVAGLIASAGFSIVSLFFLSKGTAGAQISGAMLIAVCLYILRRTKTNPALVILGAGAIGGFIYSYI